MDTGMQKIGFLRLPQVLSIIPVCRASWWRGCQTGRYPKPVKLGPRTNDAAFASAWDEALTLGVEGLEDEARRRAYEGWLEPVWNKGVECGVVRKFSDTLLIVLLKGHKPEKYRENARIEHAGKATLTWEELLKHLSPD
jgi:predicted DNA-binding transcriptional regulator AlpA